jgi:hypothetical protein
VPHSSARLRRTPETYSEEEPHDDTSNDAIDQYRHKHG